MSNLSLRRRFALISLNGERVKNTTAFNDLKERCMITALLLDFIVSKKILLAKEYDCIACDPVIELSEGERAVYNYWKENGTNSNTLADMVNGFLNIPHKERHHFYKSLIDEMVAEQLIEIIPSLLECDLDYQTSGVKIREYRSADLQYQNVVNDVRAELFNEDTITDENVTFVWLLKQSGDISNIFTLEEIHKIDEIITELSKKNHFVESLYHITVKGMIPRTLKTILKHKNAFAKTPFGSGVVSRIPALEKRESIFIQTEKMFSDSWERTEDVIKILESNGHICKVKTVGAVSLVEIDHVLYELVPDAVSVTFINIHGVRLRRYMI